jgi:hypothetical protein
MVVRIEMAAKIDGDLDEAFETLIRQTPHGYHTIAIEMKPAGARAKPGIHADPSSG